MNAPALDRLERWMFEIVSHPAGVGVAADCPAATALLPEGASALEDVVLPSRALSSKERIAVYANMYYWRLIDCLVEDFEIVRHALGVEPFFNLTKAYLSYYPSRSYSLTRLGDRFAHFIREDAIEALAHRDFLAELAELEWVIANVFNETMVEPLPLDALLAVPGEAWADVRFELNPAFRLLAFEYPTNIYFQRVRDDQDPLVPGPKKSWVAVFRKEYTVWRLDLDRERYTLLEALHGRATLSEAIARCATLPDIDTEALTQSLMGWFRDWTADHFFTAVHLPENAA